MNWIKLGENFVNLDHVPGVTFTDEKKPAAQVYYASGIMPDTFTDENDVTALLERLTALHAIASADICVATGSRGTQ